MRIRGIVTDYRSWGFLAVALGIAASASAWHSFANREEDPLMYKSTWTDANGLKHEVTTEIGPDPEASAAQHAAEVNALAALFPPA